MQKTVIFFILILVFSGCKETVVSSEEDFAKEVKSLSTIDLQKEFLEKIYDLDQRIRKDLPSIKLKYGFDSDKMKEAYKKMNAVDMGNIQKIELYLQQYGHPTIVEHGKKATLTPWIVIHHTSSIDSKERNFKYLYEAYKNGDLQPGSFSMYLNRFYTYKFEQRLKLPNPYKEEQLIDSLITRLDLVAKGY